MHGRREERVEQSILCFYTALCLQGKRGQQYHRILTRAQIVFVLDKWTAGEVPAKYSVTTDHDNETSDNLQPENILIPFDYIALISYQKLGLKEKLHAFPLSTLLI